MESKCKIIFDFGALLTEKRLKGACKTTTPTMHHIVSVILCSVSFIQFFTHVCGVCVCVCLVWFVLVWLVWLNKVPLTL